MLLLSSSSSQMFYKILIRIISIILLYSTTHHQYVYSKSHGSHHHHIRLTQRNNHANISELLDNLLRGYDNSIRPDFGGKFLIPFFNLYVIISFSIDRHNKHLLNNITKLESHYFIFYSNDPIIQFKS